MSNLKIEKTSVNCMKYGNYDPDLLIDEAVSYLSACSPVLPFSPEDITCGSETELQTCVKGSVHNVDLPKSILNSDFFRNLLKRVDRKEVSRRVLENLNEYLNENRDMIWENSRVYFDLGMLSTYSRNLIEKDLCRIRGSESSGKRGDYGDFFFTVDEKTFVRIPVSYFIKVSLSDFFFRKFGSYLHLFTGLTGLYDKFISDNTSPETLSMHICRSGSDISIGSRISQETLLRYLMTYLAVKYGNSKFGMDITGQECDVYFSPHVPVRQKLLSRSIPDSFYRELFMNPCLSGWDDGESKKEYMSLCHMSLGRSYLNTLIKLKDSGILSNGMIMMPDISNVSLGNNGIHISMGSDLISGEVSRGTDVNAAHEKALGDLMIKIVEHFLPLFPGYYSSAPYRTPQSEFRPEKRLGFLPHELDGFHLRNFWRRWKQKVRKNMFGSEAVPKSGFDLNYFFDNPSKLSGDFLRDHRLVDYPAAFISSDLYCPLNGILGNDIIFKNYLHGTGVFDKNMSLYLLFKLRERRNAGFTGFEARFHSLFENFSKDMKFAADLQQFLQMLAYKYIKDFNIRHRDIKSDPFTESERRNAFFSSAVGIQVLNFKINSGSFLQKRILLNAKGLNRSRRYKGFFKISHRNYMHALIKTMELDGAEIISKFGFEPLIRDVKERIDMPERNSSFARVTKSVLKNSCSKKAIGYSPEEFNSDVERYYRDVLKFRHLDEAVEVLINKVRSLPDKYMNDESIRCIISPLGTRDDIEKKIRDDWKQLVNGRCGADDVEFILSLVSIIEFIDRSET